MKKNSYRTLFVWEASVNLAVQMLELADWLVERRRFALADQLVRSACSVPNNIAEGEGRLTDRDRRHFRVQARGSLYELETQLEILHRSKLVADIALFRNQIAPIEAGLTKMINRRDVAAGQPRSPL
jgi:four helix bundle protein